MKKSLLVSGMVLAFFLSPILLKAQEQYMMLGPADMLPWQDDADYKMNGETLYSNAGDTIRTFYAPIHLPDGVRLKRVVLYYYDSHNPGNVDLRIYRENMYTADFNIICAWVSSGDTVGYRQATISADWMYNLISNTGYTYFLRIIFTDPTAAGTLMFHGARVVYQ